jgi:hypothetical protein
MEITPKSVWLRRREFLKLGAAGAGALFAKPALARAPTAHGPKLAGVKPNPKYDPGEKQTPPTTTSTSSAPARATPARTPPR